MIQTLVKLEKLDELDPLVAVDQMMGHKKELKKFLLKTNKRANTESGYRRSEGEQFIDIF